MKKSPAEDKPGQSLEGVFQEGFAGAESAPPSRIWESVDRALENQQLHRYRQQAVWYRYLAAACLLLLLSAGFLLWRQNPDLPMLEPPLATKPAKTGKAVPSGTVQEPAQEGTLVASESKPRRQAPNEPGYVLRQNSLKEAENRNSSAGPSLALTGKKKPSQETMSSKIEFVHPGESIASPATLAAATAGITLEQGQEATREEAIAESSGTKSGTVKPISRALLNHLATSAFQPAIRDSQPPTLPKSIMEQKELAGAGPLTETVPATGQSSENEENVAQKWSVSVVYSPQYAYAPVKVEQGASMGPFTVGGQAQSSQYQNYQEAIEEYNNSYTPTYSYATMVGAGYKLNEKWRLESGIQYTQNEAMTTHSYLIYGGGNRSVNQPSATPNSGNFTQSTPLVTRALEPDAAKQGVYVSRTNQYHTRYRYQQVGLPLRVSYRVGMQKLYALVGGGVNLNLLLQSSIVPETNQVETVRYKFYESDSPFRILQWSTSLSFGLGYDVSKKMSIIAAPEMTYSLSSMIRDGQRQAHPYQFGVSIGGRWRLSK